MKKQFLIRANVILGTLSLLLAGCHTQKKVVAPAEPESPEAAVRHGEVICMYGVPAQVYEKQRRAEETAMKQQQDSLQADSSQTEVPRVMLKYGVPYPRPQKEER